MRKESEANEEKEDMQIIEPWYAHLGQAFVGVLLTLPYLVGRRRKAWLR